MHQLTAGSIQVRIGVVVDGRVGGDEVDQTVRRIGCHVRDQISVIIGVGDE